MNIKSFIAISAFISNEIILPVSSFTNHVHALKSSIQINKDPTSLFASNPQRKNNDSIETSRRNLLESIIPATLAVQTILAPTSPAYASGGATAGGAYLLSAKQRYNERVIAGVKTYIGLSPSIENADLSAATAFFTSDEQGSWSDFAAAGYLLSNAFRRSSSTAPDALPSVKKWKAFAGQVEALQKAIKKKSKSSAQKAYAESMALLDDYLDAVELPAVLEMQAK